MVEGGMGTLRGMLLELRERWRRRSALGKAEAIFGALMALLTLPSLLSGDAPFWLTLWRVHLSAVLGHIPFPDFNVPGLVAFLCGVALILHALRRTAQVQVFQPGLPLVNSFDRQIALVYSNARAILQSGSTYIESLNEARSDLEKEFYLYESQLDPATRLLISRAVTLSNTVWAGIARFFHPQASERDKHDGSERAHKAFAELETTRNAIVEHFHKLRSTTHEKGRE